MNYNNTWIYKKRYDSLEFKIALLNGKISCDRNRWYKQAIVITVTRFSNNYGLNIFF